MFDVQDPLPSGWTHIVLNDLGPNDGIRVYYDGVHESSDVTKQAASYSSGNGRVVVGNSYTQAGAVNSLFTRLHAGGDFDELLFFNQILSQQQIIQLKDIV